MILTLKTICNKLFASQPARTGTQN